MKRIILVTLVALLAIPSVTMAQKGRKEVSPIIEGKQKVRKTDYDSVWKFTTFNSKKIYYCDFDYRTFKDLPTAREFDFGNFQYRQHALTESLLNPFRCLLIHLVFVPCKRQAKVMNENMP